MRRRRGQGPHLAKRWEPRGFSRPCCEGFQRTTATQHPAHTHCVGVRARAGAPESQAGGWAAAATLLTAASQPGGAAATQKPALQTQMSLLTLQAPNCLPWGRQTRKSPSPHRRERTRLPLKQVRVREALCLPPCGSGKIASQGAVLNQGLLGPGLEGGAWSQEPTLLSMGFSSKNTGVGCCFLLHVIFLTQGSSPHLPIPLFSHCYHQLWFRPSLPII